MVAATDTGARPPRIRLGMVGGGEGAFIGAVHRIAARLDDQYELVAGALAGSPEKALRSGAALGLDPARAYANFATMAEKEAARADGIEAVSIVTPNHVHFAAAKAFLERGVHVICDKPMTTTLADALALAELVDRSGRVFCLTHNYSGYPMVRQARAMVAEGALGAVRVVQVEYAQDWLSTRLEETGQKQAGWRTDPARAGAGGAIGDIGTHAFHLASFVTGLACESLCADLSRFVAGRPVDDNAHILLRYAGGARGMLWASQVAPGNENALTLRVFGDKAGITWRQEHPNQLLFAPLGEPPRVIARSAPGANAAAARVSRIPSGHPEGYLEAFATLYTEAAAAIRAARDGSAAPAEVMFPGVLDGVAGVGFITAAVESAAKGAAWVKLPA